MKLKKILALVIAFAMVLSTMGTVAFAEETIVTIIPTRPVEDVSTNGLSNTEFEKTWEMPHYDWEKEAEGVYFGGIKVEETGYYIYTSSNEISTYGILEISDESNYNVYVNLEEHKIILNGLNMDVKAGPMPYIYSVAVEKYPHQVKEFMADGNTGVPGVLVITEGTYRTQSTSLGRFNWQSICYIAEGYEDNYKFGAIGLGIMDEENNWTVELVGENSIDVYSEFARPLDNGSTGALNQDAGAYGIYAEAGLTITGSGSLNTDVESNWGNPYNEQNTSVAGVWSEGNLTINQATITAETSAQKQDTMISDAFQTTLMNPLAAIGSSAVVKIESGSVTATDKTDLGSAIKGNTGVEITGGTVVADNDADIAGTGISSYIRRSMWSGEEGGYVNITGGNVIATATSSEAVIDYYATNEDYYGGAPGVGIAVGSNYDGVEGLGISISDGIVAATGSGAGLMADSSSIIVAGGTVTVIAEESGFEEGGAVVSDRGTVSLAAGTYNTTLPENFIAEGSAILDGTVIAEENAITSEWTARLGNGIYYTGADGADKAIANANVDKYATENNEVWLMTSSSAGRSGLKLGDTVTIYVAEGAEYTGELTGDKLLADVAVGEPVTIGGASTLGDGEISAGITFTPYTYTMVVDPEYANIKVVREGAEDQYFFEFGNDYETFTACYYMEHGDTVVLLNDIDLGSSSQTIRDFVTFDFNGHTITADYRYYALYISSRETGTITFTDTSEFHNGGVVNTGTGNAVSNSFDKVKLVFEDGTYSTASTTKPVVKSKTGQITGGTYTGTVEGLEVSGGTFSVAPTECLAEGYTTVVNTENLYKVVKDELLTNEIEVVFDSLKDVDGKEIVTEGEKVYNINLVAADAKTINRLNSGDLTFKLIQDEGDIAYEIIDIEKDNITVNPVNNSTDRYEFHFEDKDADVANDTANTITIAQVKFTGYGQFDFAVDADANGTNAVHATKTYDNIVDTFIPGGVVTDGETTGILDITAGINDAVIKLPTRDLTIKVSFPNTIDANAYAYQDMKITVTGPSYNEVIYLGEGETVQVQGDCENLDETEAVVFYQTVISGELVLNTPYTVTVEGAGYRTAKYTVSMTENKSLYFWNNVMDNAQAVEVSESNVEKNAQKVNFLAGDIVKDNNINVYDLSAVVSYFGEISLDENNKPEYAKYDLNRDGKIDSKDVAYVLVSWNN